MDQRPNNNVYEKMSLNSINKIIHSCINISRKEKAKIRWEKIEKMRMDRLETLD